MMEVWCQNSNLVSVLTLVQLANLLLVRLVNTTNKEFHNTMLMLTLFVKPMLKVINAATMLQARMVRVLVDHME